MFHRLKRNIWILLAALFLSLLAMPALAQEVEPTPESTVIVVPEDPLPAPEPPASTIPDGSVILPAWQLFAFIFSALLGGGALSVVGLGMLATKIMQNPAAMKNAEDVGNSVPAGTANKLIELADSAIAIAKLAKEMLDRVPASDKPTV